MEKEKKQDATPQRFVQFNSVTFRNFAEAHNYRQKISKTKAKDCRIRVRRRADGTFDVVSYREKASK